VAAREAPRRCAALHLDALRCTPDVALHLDHKVQVFKGSQQLAAVGTTVMYAGRDAGRDVGQARPGQARPGQARPGQARPG
jgi:hypothetical protein